MNDTINIVLATDGNYAQHATVAMASVLCNTQLPQRLHFFIIDVKKKRTEFSVRYSTVTDLARLRGLSTSQPLMHAVWYAINCNGIATSTLCNKG